MTAFSDDYKSAQDILKEINADAILPEADFVAKCMEDMMGGWVPLPQYLKLYPEENSNKVHMRVQQGTWKKQVHYSAPKGGSAWVNLRAIRLWLEGKL